MLFLPVSEEVKWLLFGLQMRYGSRYLRLLNKYRGEIPSGVYPKDIILHIIGNLGADGVLYKAVEFSGKVVREMSISGRMTLCNMAVEMGAKMAM